MHGDDVVLREWCGEGDGPVLAFACLLAAVVTAIMLGPRYWCRVMVESQRLYGELGAFTGIELC